MLKLQDFEAIELGSKKEIVGGGGYTRYNCNDKGDVIFADGCWGFDSDGDGIYECLACDEE